MRILLTIAAVVALAGPSGAANACTDNWSTMAAEVAANGLAPAKDLQQLAASKVPGKLIKVALCKSAYGFQYELIFLDASGQLVTLPVDARKPFAQ